MYDFQLYRRFYSLPLFLRQSLKSILKILSNIFIILLSAFTTLLSLCLLPTQKLTPF